MTTIIPSKPVTLSTLEILTIFDRTNSDRAEDPLKYWVAQKTLYPTLWKLACKYLCIPASSVPCERIFSKAGEAGQPEEEQTEACNSRKKIIFLNKNL
ncbi:hypothetical protein D4764_11G0002400 [Takifugu flavidus]|uniref:HAT C-terminal dimerisation domain-containing protein n=1 Tax=Takifugu flavidus TaxID=433684 RepID=A0A5C6PGL6_9TELE|nr:hypothetical protein D4764_11G0002400 [Takifugu flavidus]